MATVLDVGQYVVEKIPNVDKMKLYKLCFFSQAWHLTWAGKPLFREVLEAWKWGPVPRELWNATTPVAIQKGRWEAPCIPHVMSGDSSRLTKYERDVIDSIVKFYGQVSSMKLSIISHLYQSWNEARRGLPESAHSSAPMSLTTLRDECTRLMRTGEPVPTPPLGLPGVDLDDLLKAAGDVEEDWWDTFRILATR